MANTPMTTMSPRKVKYNQIDMNRQAQAAGKAIHSVHVLHKLERFLPRHATDQD